MTQRSRNSGWYHFLLCWLNRCYAFENTTRSYILVNCSQAYFNLLKWNFEMEFSLSDLAYWFGNITLTNMSQSRVGCLFGLPKVEEHFTILFIGVPYEMNRDRNLILHCNFILQSSVHCPLEASYRCACGWYYLMTEINQRSREQTVH